MVLSTQIFSLFLPLFISFSHSPLCNEQFSFSVYGILALWRHLDFGSSCFVCALSVSYDNQRIWSVILPFVWLTSKHKEIHCTSLEWSMSPVNEMDLLSLLFYFQVNVTLSVTTVVYSIVLWLKSCCGCLMFWFLFVCWRISFFLSFVTIDKPNEPNDVIFTFWILLLCVCTWHDFMGFCCGFKAQATNGIIF